MDDGLRFLEFRRSDLNLRGVVGVMKSQAVAALVEGHAARIRDAANSVAKEHLTVEEHQLLEHFEPGCTASPPYESVVKTGHSDTLGVVRSASLWGAYDSNQHHTLDSLNH